MIVGQIHHIITCILNGCHHFSWCIKERIASQRKVWRNSPLKVCNGQVSLLDPGFDIGKILPKIIATALLLGTHIKQVMVEQVAVGHDPSPSHSLICLVLAGRRATLSVGDPLCLADRLVLGDQVIEGPHQNHRS